MKLTPAQLETHLTQSLAPVYLVCGEEPFLVQETLALIRKKAADAGFSDRLRLDLESDSDLDELYSHAYTPPLLGPKRLIELHWKGDKLSKAGQQFMQAYALKPSPHCLLVNSLGKLDSKTEQTQWFKALEKKAAVISIWPLSPTQFLSWIQERARSRKLPLSLDAARKLAYLLEGNLPAAAQEIEKLSLLDLPAIDVDILTDFVSDQGCFTAFDLVDQALLGNGPQLLRVLRYLQREGTEPLMILGAFTFELRTLAKLAKELRKGIALNVLFNQYRIRMGKQAGIREFFKRGSLDALYTLFLQAGEIDRLAKGAAQGDLWLTLEQFCLAVAGLVPQGVLRALGGSANRSGRAF